MYVEVNISNEILHRPRVGKQTASRIATTETAYTHIHTCTRNTRFCPLGSLLFLLHVFGWILDWLHHHHRLILLVKLLRCTFHIVFPPSIYRREARSRDCLKTGMKFSAGRFIYREVFRDAMIAFRRRTMRALSFSLREICETILALCHSEAL